ncbi:fungal-specific transcription factor domain-containing protein [Spinellus fusiger]|nr:fungal-specific transcription factor domain-containing protein [Spinellus fusiger]
MESQDTNIMRNYSDVEFYGSSDILPQSSPVIAQPQWHSLQRIIDPGLTKTYTPLHLSADQDMTTHDEPTTKTKKKKTTVEKPRKRITRACDTCRRKKIRCDVNTSRPCSTCRQYEWECTFNNDPKKRGPPKGYIESLEIRLKKMEKLIETSQSNKGVSEYNNERERSLSVVSTEDSLSTDHSESQHGPLMHDPSLSSVHSEGGESEESSSAEAIKKCLSKIVRYHGSSSGFYLVGNILSKPSGPKDNNSPTTSTVSTLSNFPVNNPPNYSIIQQTKSVSGVPEYSDYRLRKLNAFDEDLLVVRDATEAEKAYQVEFNQHEAIYQDLLRPMVYSLVKSYFDDPLPMMPVIDEKEFLASFEERGSTPPAPLLTYAICLYACISIRPNYSLFEEFNTSQEKTIKILLKGLDNIIRKEYIVSCVSNIQAFIILCAQPIYPVSSYINWIFSGMAVRMAQDLGLHRTVSTPDVPDKIIEYRKRLWYSVYITDRWCCASIGRPLAISDSDCDIDLPNVYGTVEEQKQGKDYTLFVSFVKLSGILGEVMRRIYTPKGRSNCNKPNALDQIVYSLQRMLNEWFEELPERYHITKESIENIKRNPKNHSATKQLIEGGCVTICYYAVSILLHRPFIILEKNEQPGPNYTKAMHRCMESANRVVDIARILPSSSTIKFGWNFVVYSIFQASLIHVFNCTNKDPEIAESARNYLRISMLECAVPISNNVFNGHPSISFMKGLIRLVNIDQDYPIPDNIFNNKEAKESSEHFERPTTSMQGSSSQKHVEPMDTKQYDSPKLMSVHKILSETNDYFFGKEEVNPSLPLSFTPETSPWLLGGDIAATQAAWHQLFAFSGAPITGDAADTDLTYWDTLQNGLGSLPTISNNNNSFLP